MFDLLSIFLLRYKVKHWEKRFQITHKSLVKRLIEFFITEYICCWNIQNSRFYLKYLCRHQCSLCIHIIYKHTYIHTYIYTHTHIYTYISAWNYETVCPLSNHHKSFVTFHVLYDHFAIANCNYYDWLIWAIISIFLWYHTLLLFINYVLSCLNLLVEIMDVFYWDCV